MRLEFSVPLSIVHKKRLKMGNISSGQTAEKHLENGNAKYNLRDYSGAILDYNKAIEINPYYTEAYYKRGNAKRDIGDNHGAIQDYNKAIEINPNDADAYLNRGYAKDKLDDKNGACLDWSMAAKLRDMDAYDLIKMEEVNPILLAFSDLTNNQKMSVMNLLITIASYDKEQGFQDKKLQYLSNYIYKLGISLDNCRAYFLSNEQIKTINDLKLLSQVQKKFLLIAVLELIIRYGKVNETAAKVTSNIFKMIGIDFEIFINTIDKMATGNPETMHLFGVKPVTQDTECLTPLITNNEDISIEMIYVKGCTFQMGSNLGDDEKPVHSVTVSDFYMGKYEVTQDQWKAIMGDNPSKFKGDNLPVEQVRWNDVQEFINKLNTKTGKSYRLPTEAEWEYAARGGDKSNGYKYSGSNTLGDVAWYDGNSNNTTHAVGSKQPNELGIYDMSGNVWDWCSDRYGKYSSNAQSNPTGPSSGSLRVFRGGSWNGFAQVCRTADRCGYYPGDHHGNIGFRLVSPK